MSYAVLSRLKNPCNLRVFFSQNMYPQKVRVDKKNSFFQLWSVTSFANISSFSLLTEGQADQLKPGNGSWWPNWCQQIGLEALFLQCRFAFSKVVTSNLQRFINRQLWSQSWLELPVCSSFPSIFFVLCIQIYWTSWGNNSSSTLVVLS